MGLLTTALAFGAGYVLGKPGGREQAMSYLQRARGQDRQHARGAGPGGIGAPTVAGDSDGTVPRVLTPSPSPRPVAPGSPTAGS